MSESRSSIGSIWLELNRYAPRLEFRPGQAIRAPVRNPYVLLAMGWVILLIPFLIPKPMAATNVILAGVQGILMLRR